MKYLYWMILIFGIMQISVSLVVSQVDDPETQYDESEAPVNLAYPVSLSAVSSTRPRHTGLLLPCDHLTNTANGREAWLGDVSNQGRTGNAHPSFTPRLLLSITLLDGTPGFFVCAPLTIRARV